MADEQSIAKVHVTAEERRHPALKLLARAVIALVRSRQTKPSSTVGGDATADVTALVMEPPSRGRPTGEGGSR